MNETKANPKVGPYTIAGMATVKPDLQSVVKGGRQYFYSETAADHGTVLLIAGASDPDRSLFWEMGDGEHYGRWVARDHVTLEPFEKETVEEKAQGTSSFRIRPAEVTAAGEVNPWLTVTGLAEVYPGIKDSSNSNVLSVLLESEGSTGWEINERTVREAPADLQGKMGWWVAESLVEKLRPFALSEPIDLLDDEDEDEDEGDMLEEAIEEAVTKEKVEALTKTVERLTGEAKICHEQHESDIAMIGERLTAEANERDWCSEYDQIIDSLNRDLSVALPIREREYEVSVRLTYETTITVTARDSDSAVEQARDTDFGLEAPDDITVTDVERA